MVDWKVFTVKECGSGLTLSKSLRTSSWVSTREVKGRSPQE